MAEELQQGIQSAEPNYVTPRTYEHYLHAFCIPESALGPDKNILDVGGGLSNFTETVNERFGAAGTQAAALDRIYTPEMLGANFEEFKANLVREGYKFRETQLRPGSPENVSMKEEYEHIKRQVLSGNGTHIVGDHQKPLPGPRHLILAENSIFQKSDREETKTALINIKNALTEDGELRALPVSLEWHAGKLYVRKFESHRGHNNPLERKARLLNMTYAPDRELFDAFKELETSGCTFYLARIPPRGAKTDDVHLARTRSHLGGGSQYTLIMRRDSVVPNVEGATEFLKVSFKDQPRRLLSRWSRDESEKCYVQSEEIPLPARVG